MKSMKKLVLAGLILLASVVGLLPLVGCKNDSVPEVPKYTVKFAKGNNTEVVSDLPSNLMVESGTVLTAEQLKPLTNTEKYAFVGWYDGETKAVAGTYTVTKDVTLTAQWKKAIRVTQTNLNEGLNKAITDPDSILVLEDNITVKTPINIESGNVTIDLNGKTLKNESGTVVQVAENATLTIMDTGKGGSISGVGFGVDNYGSLTVEGGSISADGENSVGVYNEGSLTVKDGSISGASSGVYNYGILTVEGGSISGVTNGVFNEGTLTVEGGSISGVAYGVANHGSLTVEGGSISGNLGVANYVSLTVEEGSISGVAYGVENSDSGTLEVTGGSISASGAYSFGVANDGSLTVEGGSISGVYYGVKNSGTLEVTGGSISGVDYGVKNSGTLEVTGGSISGVDYGVENSDSGTLEVTGGNISGTSYGVKNSGTLEVTGGIISASGAYSYGVYNNGSLEVTDGSIEASGDNSYGVLNAISGKLTVKGGNISGTSRGVSSNGGTLNLSGAPKITTFYLTSPITIVGDLTDDNPSYSVEWKGDTTDGTKIVVGGEQVTLTADIAQKFTFKDIEVEFEESTKALVVKTN